MDTLRTTVDLPLSAMRVADLINHPPFAGFFSATVQGKDGAGEEFECTVPLDGHLDEELYLRLRERVEVRSTLFIVLRLSPALDNSVPALRLAVHGRVNRINPLQSGEYDLRISILDYQQL